MRRRVAVEVPKGARMLQPSAWGSGDGNEALTAHAEFERMDPPWGQRATRRSTERDRSR